MYFCIHTCMYVCICMYVSMYTNREDMLPRKVGEESSTGKLRQSATT
jgi:hypothetical protein